MNGEINWSQPIEAVHEDGRVVAVCRCDSPEGAYHISPSLPGGWFAFGSDGAHLAHNAGWRIRNVATPPADARTAPNGGEVGPEVVERMIALVREVARMPKGYSGYASIRNAAGDEARAIVALLPEPVDADEQYARDLIREQGWLGVGEIGGQAVLRMIATAHRAGRVLEKEAGR